VPLCPPQIPHGLTRASAVRGRRLTAWAMARPDLSLYSSSVCSGEHVEIDRNRFLSNHYVLSIRKRSLKFLTVVWCNVYNHSVRHCPSSECSWFKSKTFRSSFCFHLQVYRLRPWSKFETSSTRALTY
jgi:hypothetical protein